MNAYDWHADVRARIEAHLADGQNPCSTSDDVVLRLLAERDVERARADAAEAELAVAADAYHEWKAEAEMARAYISDLTGERDAAEARADAAEAELETSRAHILDIDAHATPFGDIPDDPGWVGTYLVTAGALHRALGKIGQSAPSCAAEARADQLAEALRPFAEITLPEWSDKIETRVSKVDIERARAALAVPQQETPP